MKKIILFFAFWGYAFSAPVELCAFFECSDCYSIRVLKAHPLEKNSGRLVILLSVSAECGNRLLLK